MNLSATKGDPLLAELVEELTNKLLEARKELFNLRFQSVTGALENSARLKLTKREIARILTVVNEREAEKGHA